MFRIPIAILYATLSVATWQAAIEVDPNVWTAKGVD